MRAGLLAFAILWPALAQAQTSDICGLLARNREWRGALQNTEQKWRVSPGTVLAVLDQESRFNPSARGQGAGGPNPSRNFGYAQANLQTWNWFLRDTGRGDGARTDFALSADFVGWHFATMERRVGPSRGDTSAQYLIYKLGEGGYRRGARAASRALAQRIEARARSFDAQIGQCEVGL